MKNKFILLILLIFGFINNSYALVLCDLCKANQPKGLEDVTHGKGPEGNIDYIIMYTAIIIVGYTLVMSIKYLVKPNEKQRQHIKNLVLDEHN